MQNKENDIIGVLVIDDIGRIRFSDDDLCTFIGYKRYVLEGEGVSALLSLKKDTDDRDILIGLEDSAKKSLICNLIKSDKTSAKVTVSAVKINVHQRNYYVCILYDFSKDDLQQKSSAVVQKTIDFLSSADKEECKAADIFAFICKALRLEYGFDFVKLGMDQPNGECELVASSRGKDSFPYKLFPVSLSSGKEDIGIVVIKAKSDMLTNDLKRSVRNALKKLSFIWKVYDKQYGVSDLASMKNGITLDEDINSVLRHMQLYDSLTNLPNRLLFKERLGQKIDDGTNGKIAVICIDMAKFHIVNDTMGRVAGDKILKKVSDYISSIASPDDILGRLGGDNFGLAVNFKEKKELYPLLQKISDCMADSSFFATDDDVALTASIGVSVYPDDSNDVSKLLDYADMAVHKALEDNVPYYMFSKEVNDEMENRLRLERDLRKAILNGKEFVLYYQPQISAKDEKVVGWEALIRWQHPELGLIMPMDFIPLAEETELILPIGEWALRAALIQYKDWKEKGYPDAKIAVNLSAVQFRQHNVAAMVNKILRQENVPPSCLELELTETVVMHDTDTASKILTELSNLGVSLSIDDFGTGYSSLSCLKNFPVNKLKIDRSFITDLETKSGNIQIVKAIIQLGHILDMEVVIEGVETQKQMEILRDNGCDFIQGFYYAKPMPADKALEYLRQRGQIK